MGSEDELLTIAEVARYYPKGTALQTITRHITQGVKTPKGVIRLEAYRIGKRWTTTAAAVERFRMACTNAYLDAPPPQPSNEARRRKAKATLRAFGWM